MMQAMQTSRIPDARNLLHTYHTNHAAQHDLDASVQILRGLQYPTGLFAAAAKTVATGYNRAWIRDNIYCSLGLEASQNRSDLVKVYRALLDILLKHEEKIDWAVKNRPTERYQYIHARYDPESMDEIWEEWGNKQNDAVGALLFKIGELESKGIRIIRDRHDLRILQKLVWYLESIEYWHDKDNGIWEEDEEIHASSVGACVAGLKQISKIVDVPEELILKGRKALDRLLPRESAKKETDLALLSLIYPYDIVTREQAEKILAGIHSMLERNRGICRYVGDQYYHKGGEAEWCFGFPWLAIIYRYLKRPDMYALYMRKTLGIMNRKGEIPELYFAGSDEHNENSPLGWAQALFLVAGRLG
ncbi:glycoside hydrolase family 15 [Candidatus Woesearchaeota archaeon]|nr:glycoside hydrolase family 15 [Candidatus Woesearchaeota archaeon]